MAKYIKRPVVVEAEQWFPGRNVPGVHTGMVNGNLHDTVTTTHGQVTHIAPGDYIIKEPDGNGYYPCKPSIFDALYSLVEEG